MAVQNVNNSLLQLLNSNDKNIQDFLSTISTGDTLKGRVVDILQGENKAIINFKGFNIISELPQGAQLQKGDIINVSVSQINDKIFMKLLAGPAADLGKGIEAAAGQQQVTTQQLIDALNSAKVPVNEQNIFIAQKLTDYHLPVNSENINDINSALNDYMEAKGLDVRAFNIDSPQTAKNVFVTNLVNFSSEADKIVQNGSSALQEQAQGNNIAVTGQADVQGRAQNVAAGRIQSQVQPQTLVQMAQTLAQSQAQTRALAQTQVQAQTQEQIQVQTQGQVQAQLQISGQDQTQVQGQTQTVATAPQGMLQQILAPDTALARLSNMLNTLTTIAAAIPDISVSNGKDALIVTIRNAPPDLAGSVVNLAVKDGFISQQNSGEVLSAISDGQPAVVNAGNLQITRLSNNDIEIRMGSIKENLEAISTQGLVGQAADAQTANNMKDVMLNKLLGTPSEGSKAASNVSDNPDIMSVVPQDTGKSIQQIRDAFNTLKSSINNPGDSNFQQNIRDIAGALARINSGSTALNNKLSGAVNGNRGQLPELSADSAMLGREINQLFQKVNFKAGGEVDNTVAPKDFMKFQAAVRDFISRTQDLTPVKSQDPVKPSGTSITIAANSEFDVESTIESLTFLKSRDIPLQNGKFIDTMGKYFKDDMKLNQNIESLSNAIAKFDSVRTSAKLPAPEATLMNALSRSTSSIKTMVQQLAIDPQESNLKQQVIDRQFRDFITNSGLNLESRLKDSVLSQESQTQAAQTAPGKSAAAVDPSLNKENLKSAMVNLSNQLQKADAMSLTPDHKEAVRMLKDASSDIQTNLNAIQFINQKPAAYEIIYTQIPVLMNNKLFNGEMQVWYRKGSLKENLDKAMPVNIVFMLNTSNLGSVKVSMTVYKNDVDCVVNASSEKAKQALIRGKSEFLGNVEGAKYKMKAFKVFIDDEQSASQPSSGEGYVSLGRINLQA
jgi:hypothetical protein